MKKRILWCLLAALLLTGCSVGPKKPYQYRNYTLFDTVTTILGYGESEEAFKAQAEELCDELMVYHRLFDIYHEYEGLVNLKTVNDRAALEPVKVDPVLMEFLLDCVDAYDYTQGRVNIAMGAVLQLWHEARSEGLDHPEEAKLPDGAALEEASRHCDPADLILDPEAGTVFFRDPKMKLDVGAAGKGWAVEKVCSHGPENFLVSVGGNVRATGPKIDGSPWVVGVQNPDGGQNYLKTLELTEGSAVTSGDYQRYYTVDGKTYHHIIDPDTRMPGTLWRSVTVLCEDSGLADYLSTALFLMPREDGQNLLDCLGGEAMWADAQGQIFMSPGFGERIHN